MQETKKRMAIGWRSYLLALAITILVGISYAAEPLDRFLELSTGKFAWRPVSGETIAIMVDDKTMHALDSPELTADHHAKIIDAARQAGIKRVFLDYQYHRLEKDVDFEKLVSSVNAWGNRAVLAIGVSEYAFEKVQVTAWPSTKFNTDVRRACICWEYMFWQVWEVPFSVTADRQILPSFSSIMADLPLQQPGRFPVDYAYDTDSITKISAIDLLEGKFDKAALEGKDAILAPYTRTSFDRHYFPGHNSIPGADIHILAGETLKRGIPLMLEWIPPTIGAALLTLVFLIAGHTKRFLMISVGIAIVLIASKLTLIQFLVHIKIGPSIILLITLSIMIMLVRRKWSVQQQNPISGLPNFNALRSRPPFGNHSVVAASIVNYAELATYLSSEDGQKLIEQVARRLQIASSQTILHHDADGSFAWLSPLSLRGELESQLSGLAALFHTPVTIGDRRIDVNIAFGINDELEGSNTQRLAAARGAVNRAAQSRNLVEHHASSQDDDAIWNLSFHSQLKDALSNGDFWVAFQPQFEMSTGHMIGVEALARWTHPSRGPIPPDQFIVQAEKSQDIYRLTLFVMQRSIQSGAELRAAGHDLAVSVNLSAALLDIVDLSGTIHKMLQAHAFPPSSLTIEITETAQFEDSAQALETLTRLRQSGVRLSIDDYGTGQSNLEYFTRIEADEIKIDKSFVKTMRESQRNFEIVKSTIELAHRLGAVAVAEGIEDQATLTLLRNLGCDVGQGYHLGKPQLFFEIMASLDAQRASLTA